MWSKRNCFAGTGRSSSSAINPPAEAGWRPGRTLCLAALFAGALWAAGGPASAAGAVKLTDGAEFGGQWARQIQISPDGTRVVFTADTPGGDIAAVFSVPIGGGPVTQLAGGTVVMDNYTASEANILDVLLFSKKVFQIAPDGQSVIYSSEPSAGHVDLYSTAIAGGPATHLGSLDGNTIGSLRFEVTPNSSRVLYNAPLPDKTLPEPHTVLYSAPASGGQAPLTLFDFPPQVGTGVFVGPYSGLISPNGTKAIACDANALYIRGVDGGPTTKLASTDFPYAIQDRRFTADGSRVLYTAQNSELYPSAYYVYSVGADGGAPVLIYTDENSSNPKSKGIAPGLVVETPDGSRYIAAETAARGQTRFVSIDLASGASTELGTATIGTDRYFERRTTRHDAAGAVYMGTDDAGTRSWWYVSFAGGDPVRLSDDLASAASYPGSMLGPAMMSSKITPDDQTVVYNFATADGMEYYSVPIGGGSPVRLDAGPGDAPYVLGYSALTPDGQYVIYTVGEGTDYWIMSGRTPITGLYAVNVHGGTPWLLNDPLAEGECISGYSIAPDGTVVYWAGSNEAGYDLYAAPVPEPAMLGLLAAGALAVIGRRRLRPARLLCLATLLAGALLASTGGPAAAAGAVKLTDGAARGGTLGRQMEISPDGTRVVFTADTPGGDIAAVFSVPITGGPVTQLSGGTVVLDNYTLSGNVFWIGHRIFDIAPDGLSVIYNTEPSVGNVDLMKAPISGGTSVQLASLATSHVDMFEFQIASDSAHVIYDASNHSSSTTENRVSYSVPAFGGASPVTLFDVAPQSIGVIGQGLPAISPDGQRVICNEDNHLYIQDIGGGPITTLGTVDSFLVISSAYFTGDGSHIIYHAGDTSLSNHHISETYSVNVDGTNTILLSSFSGTVVTLPLPKGVLPAPYAELDGSHLLRSANPSAGVTEFRSFSLDTGTSTVVGTVTCPADRAFYYLQILHDLSGAVYQSTDGSGTGSLWYAPFTDGQARILADNVHGAEAGFVGTFPWLFRMALTPDDQTLVYGSMIDAGGIELYSVSLAGGGPVRLDAGPGDADYIHGFSLTPDGQYVIYSGGAEPQFSIPSQSTVTGLYAVSVHGGTPWMLNDPLAEGECISGYTIAPDGTVVYWAGSNADGYDLYAAAVPEPATLGLLAIGGLAVLRRRRRQGRA